MRLVSLAEYDKYAKELHELCQSIKSAKRPVYAAGGADMFRNFRLGAYAVQSTPGHDLSHQFMKQVNSTITLLTHPSVADAEKDTRFADVVNYAELGYVMWKTGVAHERTGKPEAE